MSEKLTKTQQTEMPENERRRFMAKFGKLAAITPIAVATIMSPETSAAPKSCTGNGAKRC